MCEGLEMSNPLTGELKRQASVCEQHVEAEIAAFAAALCCCYMCY